LYDSPNVVRVFKSKRVRWAGDVRRMGEIRNAYRISVRNLKGGDLAEDLGVIDGKIILEWFLWKQRRKVWTGYIWLWIGTSDGLL
jgi:hypothetical protein